MLFSYLIFVDAINHSGLIIYAEQVSELKRITTTDHGMTVGANVTVSQFQSALTDLSKALQGLIMLM